MSAAGLCAWAAGHTDYTTNKRAYDVWHAALKACDREIGTVAAIGHAYRIELLFRALVVVMARRSG